MRRRLKSWRIRSGAGSAAADCGASGGRRRDGSSLILGERRLRASRLAGKTTIPAIVKRVSEQQAAEMTLVENLQRQDLNCLEQAEAFANLSTEFKLTQEEIGERVGVSREQVSNYHAACWGCPEGVIGALQKGKLTYSHARVLLRLTETRGSGSWRKRRLRKRCRWRSWRTGAGGECAEAGLRRSEQDGASAVGGSECEGGAAVAGDGAGDEGADPGPEGKRQDCDRVWDAGGF